MRRALSLALLLFFSLGPLTSALASADDANLPACCRRNGAHHCEMSSALQAWMLRVSSSTPAVSAPSHCPGYPSHAAATSTSAFAAAFSANRLADPADTRVLGASQPALLTRSIGPISGRGPPASLLV